jgi:hypothetical protein
MGQRRERDSGGKEERGWTEGAAALEYEYLHIF